MEGGEYGRMRGILKYGVGMCKAKLMRGGETEEGEYRELRGYGILSYGDIIDQGVL